MSHLVPRYLRQIRPGKSASAYVTIDKKRIHLGVFDSPGSHQKFAELIAARYPKVVEPKAPKVSPPPGICPSDPTLEELIRHFMPLAEVEYAGSGALGDFRRALEPVLDLFGSTPANDFRPRDLKAVRQTWIDKGLARRTINRMTRDVVRFFEWAVDQDEELIEPSVCLALAGVRKVRRTAATKEPKNILPVPDGDLADTLAELGATVGDMVRLQLNLGCRPGELLAMRPCDIDRGIDSPTSEKQILPLTSGVKVWTYKPDSHKTTHLGHGRTIYIVPESQAILAKYLFRSPTDRCFEYTVGSYAQAVERAALRAGVDHWTPNQLRHNAGTEARRVGGLDGAQALLGHRSAKITETYAELDGRKAAEVALKIARKIG